MRTSLRTCAFVAAAGAATLFITSAPAVAASSGSTALVDVAADGTPGNGLVSYTDISADGRYVAFVSEADNLVPGDADNVADVFVRDTVGGTTTLVSGAPGGQPANGRAHWGVAISGNGRYVAFTSMASNLIAGDTNNRPDIFVHDRQTGVTTRENVFTGGRQVSGPSFFGTISDNGRHVEFLIGGGADTDDEGVPVAMQTAFVHDRQTGRTTRVGRPVGGGPGLIMLDATVSGNGKRVVFTGWGDWLGDGTTGAGVYVYDLASRVTVRATRLSVGSAAGTSISRDGGRVGWHSEDRHVPADTNSLSDVYVHDLITEGTTLVSAGRSGSASGGGAGRLTRGGRYVVFSSTATDLVASDANGSVADVFVRDLNTGRTTAASVTATGATGNGDSSSPVASADGSRVAFLSRATDLGVDPGHGRPHLYLHCLRNC
ncbi:PD40 domain-containing protein [Actinoplanes cyaneus]|uniref:PD40 domain-containing protein n=1 Tax=Actinoplanes cyaneus TaxID=52696 RepID=UPI0019421A2B|nr:PD40 domain-containing protein [Actinoplanes cyaneus]